jgi:hypothetical protein
MDLGESLQVAEVLVGTLSLFVASLSACLTWHAVKGKPPPRNLLHHGAR